MEFWGDKSGLVGLISGGNGESGWTASVEQRRFLNSPLRTAEPGGARKKIMMKAPPPPFQHLAPPTSSTPLPHSRFKGGDQSKLT